MAPSRSPRLRRSAHRPSPPVPMLDLQRAAGNAAVSALLGETTVRAERPLLPVGRVPVVMRDSAPDVGAPRYTEKFSEEIGDGVRGFLTHHEFALPSPFLRWSTPKGFSTAVSALASMRGGSALLGELPNLIRPADLETVVNRGRKKGTIRVTDDKTTWTEEQSNLGPEIWFPDVSVEIGQVLAQRFIESVARMGPRYIDARVAAVVQAEMTSKQSLLDAPEASAGIVTSHPIDQLTLSALTSGGVLFDWPGYHFANPGAVGRVQVARQVCYCIEPAQNGTYWIRVTSPADPLPEEVALALFGTSTMSDRLAVSAPPLFGFGDARGLRPQVRAAFDAVGIDTTNVGDPAKEGLSGPLADEIALGQSNAPPNGDKQGVLGTMNESLLVLDRFVVMGAPFGVGRDPTLGNVTAVRARLVKKQSELAAAPDETALRWAGQVTDQRRVLTQVAFGFGGLVERFETMTRMVTDATAKLGGFSLPPYVREAMHSVAMQYVDAAATSFFPATADTKVQAADLASRLLPVTFLEATMAAIQRTVDDALENKRKDSSAHSSYDATGMQQRERALRVRLGLVRVTLLNNPTSAGEELAKLQAEILDLQTEAEIVANMDQLDMAWQALDDSLSFWFSSTGTRASIGMLKDEADAWHARWNAVFALWKKGDQPSRDQAKTMLADLRGRPELGQFFGRLRAAVKDAQTEAFIGKIVAMLVITVVTAGVGEFIAGAALGAELSTGATLVAVGSAEAFTFTLLSQVLLDTDHSAGHVAYEFAANIAMFGALRRFAAFGEAAKLSRITAATGQAVLLSAMGLAKEEIALYVTKGKHLTREEIGQIALQSLVMFVALNGVGKLAEPIMKTIKAEGTMLALRRNAANRAGEGLRTMQAALAGSKDPALALKYIEAERAWLDLKVKAYGELETAALAEAKSGKPPKDGGVLKQSGMTMADIAAMKTSLGKHADVMAAAKSMLTLEPLAPDMYGAPRARLAEVLRELGGGTLIATDPTTTVRTYEAKSPEGKPVTIVERLDQYDRWLLDLQRSLNPTELAKLEQMTVRNTPQEVHDRYGGDKDVAALRIRVEVEKAQGAAGIRAASATRMAELKLRIADNALMRDPDIVKIIDALPEQGRSVTVAALRDAVMSKILAGEAVARARATDPSAEVLTGIKIYQRQSEQSVNEWLTNNPGRAPDGLTLRVDGLYMQRGEIDVLVVVRESGGKWRIVSREEIKTGNRDTNADAARQVEQTGSLLAQDATGGIRLELGGKDITSEINMASDAAAHKATRGPSDKQFDESLGITAGDLERLVKSLIVENATPLATGKDTK